MTQAQAAEYLIQQWALTAITLGGVLAAIFQLWRIAKSNKVASVAALLQIESVLGDHRAKITNITIRTTVLFRKKQRQEITETDYAIQYDPLDMEMKSTVQNYLNSLDRLCACVLRGIFHNRHAKADYHQYLVDAIKTFADQFRQPDCPYTNILVLKKHWDRHLWRPLWLARFLMQS